MRGGSPVPAVAVSCVRAAGSKCAVDFELKNTLTAVKGELSGIILVTDAAAPESSLLGVLSLLPHA